MKIMVNAQCSMVHCIVLLFLVIGLSTCRSHKKIIAPVSAPIEETAFYTSCYPIKSIYVPSCKLEIADGSKSISLNGSIYIQHDSICYFRGKMVVEVMRGVIYRDSFVVVNYLERICFKGKNDYLQRLTGYPVNPESLLMLFTADRCEETYRDKFSFIPAPGNGDRILMQGTNRGLLEMTLNGDNHIENIALYNSRQRQAIFSATYSGYNHYRQFILPTGFNISAHDGKKPVHIKANFREILFDQPQQVNISIPSRYEVVVLQ